MRRQRVAKRRGETTDETMLSAVDAHEAIETALPAAALPAEEPAPETAGPPPEAMADEPAPETMTVVYEDGYPEQELRGAGLFRRGEPRVVTRAIGEVLVAHKGFRDAAG